MAYALSELATVAGRVPAQHLAQYERLEVACHSIDSCQDLPTVFLHGDCHPWNSVRTPEGDVVLIDWDSAGPGPAVIDVGFLLLSCDTGGIVGALIPPDPRRLEAIVAGYSRYHTLSGVELDRLADAIRFRTLVGGAAAFARLIIRERSPNAETWWWQRYAAADEIAARARRCIDMYGK